MREGYTKFECPHDDCNWTVDTNDAASIVNIMAYHYANHFKDNQ